MIREVIVTTLHADGAPHIAPMGIHTRDDLIVIAPFRPSATLDNLEREGHAAVNMTDDVMIFAGCLTGRRDWPVTATEKFNGVRLAGALAHIEVEIVRVEENDKRPEFYCRKLLEQNHAPFQGMNRAQAAVLEAAILASRLDMLPAEKIDSEIEYLKIAIDKTAGENERTAWGWLMDRIATHRRRLREGHGA